MPLGEYVPLALRAVKKFAAANSFTCKIGKRPTLHGAVWVLCMFTSLGLQAHQELRIHPQLDLKCIGAAATIQEDIVAQTFAVAMHADSEKKLKRSSEHKRLCIKL